MSSVQREIYSGGVLNDIRAYSGTRHQIGYGSNTGTQVDRPRTLHEMLNTRTLKVGCGDMYDPHSCLTGGKASESVPGLVTQQIGLRHRILNAKEGGHNSVGTQNHINRCAAAFRCGVRQNGSRRIRRIRRYEQRFRCQPGCDCGEIARLCCTL